MAEPISRTKATRLTVLFALALQTALSLPAAPARASAAKLAVLELRNEAQMKPAEVAYLTDRVRDAASRALPGGAFLVMTRESIQDLLPPNVRLEDCLSAECEVAVGRRIGADYIVTGEVLEFDQALRLTLKAHHCASGSFLGGETVGGATASALEAGLGEAAGRLFARVRAHGGSGGSTGGQKAQEGPIGETPRGSWAPPDATVAVVEFASDPPGAVVIIDGRMICQSTPCSRELPLGPVTVMMQKERYLPRQETVTVRQGAPTLRLSWALPPDFGWLTVTSTPPGLPVLIDGAPAGQTPLEAHELAPAAYEVKVSSPRYYEKGEHIVLARGERRTVSIAPEPREGAISVSAVDADSNAVVGRVNLDGTEVGATPGTFKAFVGRHMIQVRTAVAIWQDSVTVKERQVTAVRARLKLDAAGGVDRRRFDPSGAEFVWIPAGSFEMGCVPGDGGWERDETPRHRVTLTKGFWLQTTEVTVGQYRRFAQATGRQMPPAPGFTQGDDHPAVNVTWDDVVAYCRWAGGRLPTEAQWEYATRGGRDGQVYPWGNSESHDQANHEGTGGRDQWVNTSPVGSFPANGYGLFDMAGNVHEWCADWFEVYPSSSVVDPQGPNWGQGRVLRGGSWNYASRRIRCSARNRNDPTHRFANVGFRCLRDGD